MGKPIPLRRAGNKGAGPVNLDDGEDYRGNKALLPYGFRYAPDGSIDHIISQNDFGGTNWGFLCSPIEFLATTEDETGKAPGLLVRIKNNSGKWHQIAFPRSALIGGDTLLSELVHHGLQFAPVGKVTNDLKRMSGPGAPQTTPSKAWRSFTTTRFCPSMNLPRWILARHSRPHTC